MILASSMKYLPLLEDYGGDLIKILGKSQVQATKIHAAFYGRRLFLVQVAISKIYGTNPERWDFPRTIFMAGFLKNS